MKHVQRLALAALLSCSGWLTGPAYADTQIAVRNASGNQCPVGADSLSCAVPVSGTITANNASVGTNNAAAPGSSTQIGASDGTNLQAVSPTNPLPVRQVPTSGGSTSPTLSSAIVPNNTTGVSVKASAGSVFHIEAFSNSASTPAYIKWYNSASAPTCGSGTPIWREMIPSGGGYVSVDTQGLYFSTGISYCITTGIADADTTAPAASTYLLNITYK